MRVISGTARGRRLSAPPGRAVRPTSDRVREAAFNMLVSRHPVNGIAVVDLFAGTGALGIEALSRGAVSVTFVEREAAAIATIRANLRATGLDDGRAAVVRADAVDWCARALDRFDVGIADPPYAFPDWGVLLERLPAHVGLLESDRELDPGPGWDVEAARRHGTTVVTLVRRLQAQE